MSIRSDRALENHRAGMNCSQSVACVFCDAVGMDETLMRRIMEGFGLGMGCMEGTCGALSGAVAVASLRLNDTLPACPTHKQQVYAVVRQIMEAFQDKNGSVLCKDLKGAGTGKPLRSCDGCIQDAVEILERTVFAASETE